jgi:hypothetical protein
VLPKTLLSIDSTMIQETKAEPYTKEHTGIKSMKQNTVQYTLLYLVTVKQ